MKIIKRTKKYLYVELGEKDLESVYSNSDLIRVEREDIDKKIKTLSDKVKCDDEYEEIDYPSCWVVKNGWEYEFNLPNNIDDLLENKGC